MPTKIEYLQRRSLIVWSIRRFFHLNAFIEIDAPIIVRSPGLEPYLDAFEVVGAQSQIDHISEEKSFKGLNLGQRKYLHTSPEYALKRLLAQGADRLFSISACFRDEPVSRTHQPEFTMLEWYVKGQNLFGLMDQCEALMRWVAQSYLVEHLNQPPILSMTKEKIIDQKLQTKTYRYDLTQPFERLSVRDAFIRYAGIDYEAYDDVDQFREIAKQKGIRAEDDWHWDDLFFQILMDQVEPQLGMEKPTFLWGYPASQAALAKIDPTHPKRALRFELFIAGIELGNAFDELSDSREQRQRLMADQKTRAQLAKPIYPIDEKFVSTLEQMGDATGIAIGLDRLVMLFSQADQISDIRCQAWDE